MADAYADLEALWAGVFGEPPSISADPVLLVRVLVAALPPAPPYAVSEAPRRSPLSAKLRPG